MSVSKPSLKGSIARARIEKEKQRNTAWKSTTYVILGLLCVAACVLGSGIMLVCHLQLVEHLILKFALFPSGELQCTTARWYETVQSYLSR
jgi:hypothetical protein